VVLCSSAVDGHPVVRVRVGVWSNIARNRSLSDQLFDRPMVDCDDVLSYMCTQMRAKQSIRGTTRLSSHQSSCYGLFWVYELTSNDHHAEDDEKDKIIMQTKM
jgi:hypothetical protein